MQVIHRIGSKAVFIRVIRFFVKNHKERRSRHRDDGHSTVGSRPCIVTLVAKRANRCKKARTPEIAERGDAVGDSLMIKNQTITE